jgi:hypothetical protein
MDGSLVLASLAMVAAHLRYPSVLRFSAAREDARPLGRSALAVAPGDLPPNPPAKGWFSVAPIPLEGRSWSPIAYRLTLDGKSVLVSGRIPLKLSQEAGQRLIADLIHPPGDIRGDFTSEGVPTIVEKLKRRFLPSGH